LARSAMAVPSQRVMKASTAGNAAKFGELSGATHYCDREAAFRIRNKCQIVLGDGWVPVLVGRAVEVAAYPHVSTTITRETPVSAGSGFRLMNNGG